MRPLTEFLVIILLISYSVKWVKAIESDLVNYYVNLINNRTQEALKYEFATNARMYEPKDKKIRGM